MLEFFYNLGRDIQLRLDENVYVSDFYNNVSKDLIHSLPDAHSFSVTNLRYVVRFFNLINSENLHQFGAKFKKIMENEEKLGNNINLPQLGAESLDMSTNAKIMFNIFNIPWGHIKVINTKIRM